MFYFDRLSFRNSRKNGISEKNVHFRTKINSKMTSKAYSNDFFRRSKYRCTHDRTWRFICDYDLDSIFSYCRHIGRGNCSLPKKIWISEKWLYILEKILTADSSYAYSIQDLSFTIKKWPSLMNLVDLVSKYRPICNNLFFVWYSFVYYFLCGTKM